MFTRWLAVKVLILFLFFESSLIVSHGSAIAITTNSSAASASQQDVGSKNFLVYQNPGYKVKINYPSDWTISQTGLRDHSNIIAFYSPLENISDAFSEHVVISLNHYSQNLSLSDYDKLVDNTLSPAGIKIVEPIKTVMLSGGRPAHTIVFAPPTPPLGPNALSKPIVKLLWTVLDNSVYTISYNAEAARYSTYLPLVQKMIDSFEITKQQ
ncbi:MAG TPA: hypothetical protein VH500_02230 [Nitrososphaeraceae archaeon]